MTAFGGWHMPLQYKGILTEHLHTRAKAGLFDVSHMGELLVQGPAALGELDRLLTCRLDDLQPGRCRYGFLLREDGGILDDLIVFRTGAESWMLCVNAATTGRDARWVAEHLEGAAFRDASAETAKLDLQGPLADAVMRDLMPQAVGLERFHFREGSIRGIDVLASRTGYTGEPGFELFFSAEAAEALWDLLIELPDVQPAGLGARDTLRLEKGYPLYGSDIDEEHNPIEAGLERFVCREKDFIGRDALPAAGATRRVLTGFVCSGRRSARAHYRIYAADSPREADVSGPGPKAAGGGPVGQVTSGTFSPSLKRAIGLGYVDRAFAEDGRAIVLRGGGAAVRATITSPPFVG